jgi:CheY-like chemotaxis protein/GAF domain-containing protein
MSPDPAPILLLIEDDLVDRMATVRLLGRSGLGATLVELDNGDELLQRLAERPYDAVLMDYRLPGASGGELMERLRGTDHPPVIMLSGQEDRHVVADLMKRGAADYLAKDALSAERLATTVRNAIAADRAERRARRSENALRAVVAATATVVGADFLAGLVRQLAEICGVREAFVAELLDGGVTGRVLARWRAGQPAALGEYPIASAPCREALAARGAGAQASVGVAPARLELTGGALTAAAYRGIALRGADGRPLGVLALLADRPIERDDGLEGLLSVLASRAAAEVGRMRVDRALAASLRLERGLSRLARTLVTDAQPASTVPVALQRLLEAAVGTHLSYYQLAEDQVSGPGLLRVATAAVAEAAAVEEPPFMPWRAGFRRWENDLGSGIPVSGVVRLLPGEERAPLGAAGVCALVALPVHRDGEWVGVLRLDHRAREHRWQPEEIGLLRSAAELLGSYLERRPGGSPTSQRELLGRR